MLSATSREWESRATITTPMANQTVVLPGQDGILDFDSDDVYVPGARSSVGNPFLFTGQRFDPETGLLYYKNRHDSTFFGRFMQRDPLDYANGANLYQYVRSNPVRWLDPDGDLCCCVDDVSIVNVKKRIVRPRFGHSFDARIKINYKKNGGENV
jgi:RHS repeat-associated protein